ncbi:MAG: hypothetical protein ACREPY_03720 [Rhodanobacteraceae bacterium]
MARFVALLLIGPWLAVLAWLYWLYVRKSHATPALAHRDVIIIVMAFVAAILGTAIGWQAAFGHAGPIWKQVAAALGAYAGFNVVLLAGLLRHWWARRRSVSAP